MPVTSTTITWNSPFPGAGGSGLALPNIELSCHDRTQGRLYQILRSNPLGTEYICTLDMDDCVELSRITIDGGTRHNLFQPCAIEGTDWIVATGDSSTTSGYSSTYAINISTGSIVELQNLTVGGGNEYTNNTVYYVFSTPLGSGRSVAWGILRDDNATFGRVPNIAFAAVTVDHATGALAFIAYGDKGPAKTSLSLADATGETFCYTFVRGDETATTATVYGLRRKATNGVSALADRWSRRHLYSITVNTSLVWSYTEIGSFNDDTPPDAAPGYTVLGEFGGFYKFGKNRLVISTNTTETVGDDTENLWLLSTVDCSVLAQRTIPIGTSLNRRVRHPQRSVAPYYMYAHMHPTNGIFAMKELGQEVLLLDDATLVETVWLSSADLAANGNVDWPAAFIDASRCAIYQHGFGPNNEFVRLTFPCDSGGGGSVGEPSLAEITGSIGGITGVIRAITVQPCPIVGQGTGRCLTGRSSWSPGIGQILSGRDDVTLPCD